MAKVAFRKYLKVKAHDTVDSRLEHWINCFSNIAGAGRFTEFEQMRIYGFGDAEAGHGSQ